ncbi:helix-turn-helix transcriptional regulator [Neopoerus faecalis]|uniref:helix-turn-helix transcriptional regulator n=1 Tax=Neopoerus faecalis TaxID=3032125 RepID=UPI002570DBE6|nr:helix-turn-helix domain-containing protein [Neopoerus faecalis]
MTPAEPVAVNMTQAAQLLGVSRPTLYRLAKVPGFPVVHLGGCTRVLVDDLRAWARQQAQEE